MQPNNYASFYDEARQSYSLLFDSESAAIQFAKQVNARLWGIIMKNTLIQVL